MSETCAAHYLVDSETLETIGRVDYKDDATEWETHGQTAHGQLLPDGHFINIYY